MKITIACIGKAGRAKHDAAQSLIESYRERLPWPVAIREVEDKKQGGTVAERKSREAALLLAAVPRSAVIVALDERGRSLSSRQFAFVRQGDAAGAALPGLEPADRTSLSPRLIVDFDHCDGKARRDETARLRYVETPETLAFPRLP